MCLKSELFAFVDCVVDLVQRLVTFYPPVKHCHPRHHHVECLGR